MPRYRVTVVETQLHTIEIEAENKLLAQAHALMEWDDLSPRFRPLNETDVQLVGVEEVAQEVRLERFEDRAA